MWRIILSDPLQIVALVGLLPHQLANLISAAQSAQGLAIPCFPAHRICGISVTFATLSPLKGTFRYITHPFATRHQTEVRAAVRLACVRHAASVQSEPGSNSSVQSNKLANSLTVDFSTSTDCSAFYQCVCLNTFATEVAFASRHPHLSVVQFVKDQHCAVSFDSSAAEKRGIPGSDALYIYAPVYDRTPGYCGLTPTVTRCCYGVATPPEG